MSGRARLEARVVPSLLVADMERTLAFYARLGFRLVGRHPADGAPEWAEVRRDDAVIQLHAEAPVGTPGTPVFSGTLYFHPDSVEALADEWRGLVPFAWGPEVMPWGQREMAVEDPDGYLLAFREPA